MDISFSKIWQKIFRKKHFHFVNHILYKRETSKYSVVSFVFLYLLIFVKEKLHFQLYYIFGVISQNTKFGSCDIFFEKCFSIWHNFFSNCLLYIFSLTNEQRNSFSGYGCHRRQENSVFAVSMATVVKGKNYSLRVSAQSNHYFLRKNVATHPIVPDY